MHVVLVSNCEQAALSRTRSLLDRYASRIAERTWATLITQEALDELSRPSGEPPAGTPRWRVTAAMLCWDCG